MRQFGFDRIAHTRSFDEILAMWQPEKVIRLADIQTLTKWKRDTIIPGKRYVIWGTGLSGSFIADAVQSSGGELMFSVDRDPSKEGEDFSGVCTYAPEVLLERAADYDYLLTGHYSRFEEIE